MKSKGPRTLMLALALTVAVLMGCARQEQSRPIEFDATPEDGQLKPRGAWVFNDTTEWKAAATRFADSLVVYPWPNPPAGVDWQTQSVVLISAGSTPTSPSGLELKGIKLTGTNAELDVIVKQAGDTQSFTAPWLIAKVRSKQIKTVTPKWRQE